MSRFPVPLRLLTVLAFLIGLGGVAPAAALSTGTLRILFNGDSITHGFNGDYTYRYFVAKEFQRQGVAVDFVGSRSKPLVKSGYRSADYAVPDFDSDHFALGGSTLAQNASWIAGEVAAEQPDVVVVAAGVNDLRAGTSPSAVDQSLRTWIAKARSARPTVRIIVSPVLDARDPSRPWLSKAIADYDQIAAGTVAELSNELSPVTMAETNRGWDIERHTSENLHPSPTGDTFIAQRLAEEFHDLGDLPGRPDIYRWTSWNRQPRVGVIVRDQRATLTWDGQALDGARIWMRRAGSSPSFPETRYARGTMTTSRLVPGATYEFRVQLIRGRVATPLGPVSTTRIPGRSKPAPVARVTVTGSRVSWTASAGATRYVVKLHRKHGRWFTRRTKALSVRVSGVTRAKVYATNRAGRSAARAGSR